MQELELDSAMFLLMDASTDSQDPDPATSHDHSAKSAERDTPQVVLDRTCVPLPTPPRPLSDYGVEHCTTPGHYCQLKLSAASRA